MKRQGNLVNATAASNVRNEYSVKGLVSIETKGPLTSLTMDGIGLLLLVFAPRSESNIVSRWKKHLPSGIRWLTKTRHLQRLGPESPSLECARYFILFGSRWGDSIRPRYAFRLGFSL